MTERILIHGGEVLNLESGKLEKKDLLVNDGIIEDVAENLSAIEASKKINAEGCLVSAGLIDLHVHFREPGQEWKETIATGSKAAVAGGFTTVCCMPNTTPTNHSAEITSFIVDQAKSAGLARVLPVGAVSIDLSSKELAPLAEMQKAGCVAFTDDGKPVSNAGMMRRAMEWAKMLGCPIFGHEEELTLSPKGVMNESALSYKLGLAAWPKASEEICIARDIELSRITGAHMHFLHVTTARGVTLIRRAKEDGINVTAEVCPHHLVFTEENVGEYDTAFKMSPPLRQAEDIDALIAGLNDGTIDCITTDHAPHDIDTKRVEFDKASFGLIGLQSAFPVVLELVNKGKFSLQTAIKALTVNPAKVLSRTNTGKVAKGYVADIAVLDLKNKWTYDKESIYSLSKNTPWLGAEFTGRAKDVLVDGKIVYQNFK